MKLRAPIALAAALVTASCAASLTKLPSGPGEAAPDAAEALNQALSTCQRIRTVSAELSVRGKIGSQGMRGRLLAGLVAPADAYLEAPAPFGSPIFIYSASGDDATLLLPRDRRVLEHGRPADVFEAIAGVPLGPADLRATLTGCADAGDQARTQRIGDAWRLVSGTSDLYLHRSKATDPWRLVAVVHRGAGRTWRADYSDFLNDLPRSIRLTSSQAPPLDLRLVLSDLEINGTLDPATFRVQVPAGAAPMTIQELRQAGPLAERSSSSNE
jgi:hypothetical protein